MSDQSVASSEDARAALASVAAMKAAAARRAACPMWLSLFVALAVSAQGVMLTTGWFDSMTRMVAGAAATWSAIATVVLVQRFRGVRLGRVLAVRVGVAIAVHVVAVIVISWDRDPVRLDGAGPLMFGAIDAAAILTAFALIALVGRAMRCEDRYFAKMLTRRAQGAPVERNRLSEDGQ